MSVAQTALAAEPATDPVHAAHVGAAASQAGGQTVDAQLAEMLARIQRLEATVQQQPGSAAGATPMTGTPGMALGAKPMQGKMAGMSAMGSGDPPSGGTPGAMKPTGGMGGMGGAASPPAGAMGMMGMMDKMMSMMDKMMSMEGGAMPASAPAAAGMSGDGRMGMEKMEMAGKTGAAGTTPMTIPSDLPGSPSAPRIFHVGATGFFLDQTAAIKLTVDQQATLIGFKQKSIGDLGAARLRIDQAEQDLWVLTGSERPDPMALEAKVREIERLKGDQRIAFIRSVGEAASVLTDDQRAALLGTGAPGAAQMTSPQSSTGSVTSPKGGMGSKDPKAGMGDDSMGKMGGGKTPNTMGKGKMGGM